MEDKICKHCGASIRLVNFVLGERWMHVNPHAGFPSTGKDTLWEYCKLSVATPKEKQ